MQALLGTGNGFTASWDPPAWAPVSRRGTSGCAGSGRSAVPVKGLELVGRQLRRGPRRDHRVMSYDNDAYMQGYRVSVKRPQEAVLRRDLGHRRLPRRPCHSRMCSNASSGWTTTTTRRPSSPSSCRQDPRGVGLTGRRSITWTPCGKASASARRTWFQHVIDDVRMQAYQRTDSPTGTGRVRRGGAAVLHARDGLRRLCACRPSTTPLLNGDRYGLGHRAYVGGSSTSCPN